MLDTSFKVSIKDKYRVIPIKKEETYEWLLKKHYAHRIPPISFSFGLYESIILQGIITFGDCGGSTNSHNLIEGYKINELNRLCVTEQLPHNTLSYFVSSALKCLPTPMVIISYADMGYNHHGYIYQATNWVYCGLTDEDYDLRKGNETLHRKSFYDKYGSSSKETYLRKGYEKIISYPKHRYLMLLGSKKDKAVMLGKIPFSILPYPKGDNKRYDASYEPKTQPILF